MKTKLCKHCRSEIDKKAKVCPYCGKKQGSGILAKIVGFFLIFVGLTAILGGGNSGSSGTTKTVTVPKDTDSSVKVTVTDFSEMTYEEIQKWSEENKIAVEISNVYSNDVPDGGFISQSKEAGSQVSEGSRITISYSLGEEPPQEYQNALKRAQRYSDNMHMSRERIYRQLTSDYGEKFEKDAAEWALEHLNADYKYNALKKAEDYSSMYMSKNRIYSQLVSTYGENFTPEEAQYAVDNLEADYFKNALEKAEDYSNSMYMSKKRIYDQLVSTYGEDFTPEEAQYAIDNLEADYFKNALMTAKNYHSAMGMSANEIYNQLVSSYGEGFTAEEAQYAIDHLNDSQ
ncbi:MAG: Ltp family lipoprotein [Erysipelotrichaceae bacterium]|nr:Ltp family lipoprotein [Erysipelotrichaceae bacterium]